MQESEVTALKSLIFAIYQHCRQILPVWATREACTQEIIYLILNLHSSLYIWPELSQWICQLKYQLITAFVIRAYEGKACCGGIQSLSHVWLCDPMDCSTPGLPAHHQLPESTQTHVHRVSDAIPPSHLSSPSPPAFNLSQHQGLFHWVSSLHKEPCCSPWGLKESTQLSNGTTRRR